MSTLSRPFEENAQNPHVVLVDDDPIFAALLKKVAIKERLNLTVILSAKEAYRTLPSLDYDVALLDFDLGRVTGVQLSTYLQNDGQTSPVILVSNIRDFQESEWPATVKKAVSKKAGPYSILGLARRIHQERKANNQGKRG